MDTGSATFEQARVNHIGMRYLIDGDGPLVIFMHGFPQLAVSWRQQLSAVAAAGYSAVAPDMRGYGGTDAPEDSAQYSHFHLAGDIVALMEHLGHSNAVLVGHDLGAGLAWTMAMTMPHRVRGIVALSVPHKMRGDGPPLADAHPDFYQKRFQQLDIPETDLDEHVHDFLPGLFDLCGGTSSAGKVPDLLVPPGYHFSSLFLDNAVRPAWLDDEMLSTLISSFKTRGFRGPINWYRNMDANWHLTAPWDPWHVSIPASYVVGDQDPVYAMFTANGTIANMARTVPHLVNSQVLPGCGHWTSEERPVEVTEAILNFLSKL